MARCKHCRRLKFGHPKPYGEKDCRLEPIKNDEELKRDDCAKNELRKEARKRKRNTIDESNRSDEVKKSKNDNNTMKKEQLQEEKRRLEKIISEKEKKKMMTIWTIFQEKSNL